MHMRIYNIQWSLSRLKSSQSGEIVNGRSYQGMALGAIWNIWNLPGAPVNFDYSISRKHKSFRG